MLRMMITCIYSTVAIENVPQLETQLIGLDLSLFWYLIFGKHVFGLD